MATNPGAVVEPATLDPVVAANAARLRYVTDAMPGIRRRRAGKGFAYTAPDGRTVRDAQVLARIRSLARTFGRVLPKLRRRIDVDLRRPGLSREKALAAVVRLMEHTLARVGNVQYARRNGTRGLTTLRDRHVKVKGAEIEVRFRGKHDVQHHTVLTDPTLARIVQNCGDLPGEELFQYLDERGAQKVVTSQDVNDYLRETTGQQVTAKDFRTWAATNLALLEIATAGRRRGTKKLVVRVVERVAAALCNTPTVCRTSYIHPRVLAAYAAGELGDVVEALQNGGREPTLRAVERAVLTLLDVPERARPGAARRPARSPAAARRTPARASRRVVSPASARPRRASPRGRTGTRVRARA